MVHKTGRDALERQIASKNKILASIIMGVTCVILPVLIIIIDPIHVIVRYKLRLAKDTTMYNLLQREIPCARLSVYLFNITNAERFMSGEDYKLKVEEVGPFVFQEYRWYEDMEVSEDGKQMAMTPKVRSDFIPEASIAHPKDMVLKLPNIAMLSVTAAMSTAPGLVRFTYNMITAQLNMKAIIDIDVHNYLWGYESPLLTIANSLAPGIVYYDQLGLLDRLYDNTSDYRVIVGATDEDRFSIKSVKKFRHIQKGNIKDVEETEQVFNDTYEGIGYPPMLTPDVPINLYRLGICKTFNMKHIGSRTMDYGGEGYIYTINDNSFKSSFNPVTGKEYPEGLMDVSKCFLDLPYVLSKAHFLDSDPKLLDRIDGLNPDRNVHVNEITVDRKVSVTYDTKLALQLSLVIDDVTYNSETKMFANSVIPFVYVKAVQPKMPDEIMSKYVLVYQIAPNIVMFIIIVMILTGLVLLSHAVRLIYLNNLSRNKMVFETTIDQKLMNAQIPLLTE